MPLFYAKLFARCSKPLKVSESEMINEELLPSGLESKNKYAGYKGIQIDSPEIKIGAVLQTRWDDYAGWQIGFVQLLQYEQILVVYRSYAARTVMQGPFIDTPLPHHYPFVDLREVIESPRSDDLIVHGTGRSIVNIPQERGEPLVCDDAPGTSIPTTDVTTGTPLALEMFQRTMVFNTYLVAIHPCRGVEVVRAIDWNLYYTLTFGTGSTVLLLQPNSTSRERASGPIYYQIQSAVGDGMRKGIEWGTDYEFRGRFVIPGKERSANKQRPPLVILKPEDIDRQPDRPACLPMLS